MNHVVTVVSVPCLKCRVNHVVVTRVLTGCVLCTAPKPDSKRS